MEYPIMSYTDLAYCLLEFDQFEGAIEIYRTLIELLEKTQTVSVKHRAMAHELIGKIYQDKLQMLKPAEEEFTKALEYRKTLEKDDK